jgi:anaerobic magnesium-protoporphyrin IX monomethyl ester cyclase
VEEELGTQRNWVDSADLAMMFRGPFTTGFYRQLHTVLHREFRMRRAGRELGRALRRPRQLRRRHLGHAAAVLRHAAALPVERVRLERLARVPHEATAVSARTLAPEEAARPTPQPE